jgi:hypothetical protein
VIGTLFLALLTGTTSVEPAAQATAWSYYCWLKKDTGSHPPVFKLARQGTDDKHQWLLTWRDRKAEAETFTIDTRGNIGGGEGITWLGNNGSRAFGGIYFSDVRDEHGPTMLTVNIAESQTKSDDYQCIPQWAAAHFPPAEQPDF